MHAAKFAVTVRGEVPSDGLGRVLPHEHLVCDFSIRGGNPDNKVLDWQLIAHELEFFKQAGGSTIFELTPFGLGSDPEALKRISETAAVHIVRGISFYHEDTYPTWVNSASPETIADFFVRQIEEGHHGVRAGLLGEITSHNADVSNASEYRLREQEAVVFRAAAQAQLRTGVAISTHASLGRAGHAQLDILEAAGADLSRVVIGHCDAYTNGDEQSDLDYYIPILSRGAYIEFDLIGWNHEWPGIMTDASRAQRLARLIKLGYCPQILISTDTCRLSQLRANGGRGYDYLWNEFLPRLSKLGITEQEIENILVSNPQRVASLS